MIPTDSISLVMFVWNDLPFLRISLFYEMKWADQICILDMGSNDGTLEFCAAALRPQDVYQRRQENTCPMRGFDEARNAAGRMATGEWIIYSDADRIFDWNQARTIKERLSSTRSPVLSIESWNIPKPGLPDQEADPNLIERVVSAGMVSSVEEHRTICRRDAGVIYIGYIHEEMHLAGKCCHPGSEPSGLRQYHFAHWKNDAFRQPRYAWMLREGIRNPAKQKGTNEWWYKTYYPSKQEELDRMADDYERSGIGK